MKARGGVGRGHKGGARTEGAHGSARFTRVVCRLAGRDPDTKNARAGARASTLTIVCRLQCIFLHTPAGPCRAAAASRACRRTCAASEPRTPPRWTPPPVAPQRPPQTSLAADSGLQHRWASGKPTGKHEQSHAAVARKRVPARRFLAQLSPTDPL